VPIAASTATFVAVVGQPETIVSNNGQVQIGYTPEDSSLAGQTITVSIVPQPTQEVGSATEEVAFQLSFTASVSGAITQFNPPLVITVSYDPTQLPPGTNPANQAIYTVSQVDGTVTRWPTAVDLVHHTMTANVPHLTIVSAASVKSLVQIPVLNQP
jgi:hypothetical protein